MFNKSSETFPIKSHNAFLANCGVAALYSNAAKIQNEITTKHSELGPFSIAYGNIIHSFKREAAELLRTAPENLSFTRNTAEGLNFIANGYPFEAGDEIVSYLHEYPANYYPWHIQQERGVKIKLISDTTPPTSFSLKQIKTLVTKKTRIITLSHVQFTSGFAVDLLELGKFCQEHNIDLVIDAAQSLGCLPIYPEEMNISAIASSGWKWLLGPVGSGVLYTSAEIREKLAYTMGGAELMKQGTDYLNHTWDPFKDGRRFEYATVPISLVATLSTCIKDLFNKYKMEAIRAEVFRLQDVFLNNIDTEKYKPLVFPAKNRSGILAITTKQTPEIIVKNLAEKNITLSTRGGYLRFAPHFYNDDNEVIKAANTLNELTV